MYKKGNSIDSMIDQEKNENSFTLIVSRETLNQHPVSARMAIAVSFRERIK
jgi:hypothetical protein